MFKQMRQTEDVLSHIYLRPVRPDDAGAIARIYNEYVLHSVATFELNPVSEAEMLQRITAIAATYPYWVCEVRGEVAGYAYVHLWRERAAYAHTLESTVYVSDSFRGMGLGRRLMQQLIADCRALGYCEVLIACITRGNEASEGLHRCLGFEQVSCFKRVGFKFGQWLDVVDYELLLHADSASVSIT